MDIEKHRLVERRNTEKEIMPVKKVKGGWKVVSYSTGKTLKTRYKTKKAAQNKAKTSKRRSKRVRHTRRRY